MKLNYPKVHLDHDKVFVSFYINQKRYRLYNGKRIGSATSPNSYPVDQRFSIGNLLAAEVYKYLTEGGVLKKYKSDTVIIGKQTDRDYLTRALNNKLSGNYSKKYNEMLKHVYRLTIQEMIGDNLTSSNISDILLKYNSGVSYNTTRRHLNVLINEAVQLGMNHHPLKNIKSKRAKASLHKPINNAKDLLDEINQYNSNLYLCCLLTYGCLLRPHREIRELTWGDFTSELSYIKLSGGRNKSGRNRIVPVPSYIREIIVRGESSNNIFTSSTKPPNPDYFKTLWSRFKRVSKLIEQDQTLYSFRHSGAIDIFKRTGSITKLQKAMGHSSINVSLTYLRGLEIPELNEEDMPMI
jgi:integrase